MRAAVHSCGVSGNRLASKTVDCFARSAARLPIGAWINVRPPIGVKSHAGAEDP
jgi:hypothetical protein